MSISAAGKQTTVFGTVAQCACIQHAHSIVWLILFYDLQLTVSELATFSLGIQTSTVTSTTSSLTLASTSNAFVLGGTVVGAITLQPQSITGSAHTTTISGQSSSNSPGGNLFVSMSSAPVAFHLFFCRLSMLTTTCWFRLRRILSAGGGTAGGSVQVGVTPSSAVHIGNSAATVSLRGTTLTVCLFVFILQSHCVST